MDDNIPKITESASENDKASLLQSQVDIKRILAAAPNQFAYSDESKTPTTAAPSRNSEVTRIAHKVKKHVQHVSTDETTSAENIQTLLLKQKVGQPV